MLKTNINQKGFTIVELLIVIVIIGILAALVLNTFSGIQAKGRDTDRQNDLKAVQGQLEAVYAQSGYYPTLAQLNDATWRTNFMRGIDAGALVAPQAASGTTSSFTATATPTKDGYGYLPTQDDGTTACTASGTGTAATSDCTKYKLYWTRESGDKATVPVSSLN
jgi:prepilin-type N-terminal cleavage/methylation domain-containing protein